MAGSIADLLRCLKAAKGNSAASRACEQEFLDAGGRVEQAKLFVDRAGSALAVTADGKVYQCNIRTEL